MLSDAARIRSSAASTRLSSATRTGTTTSSRIALPIHHSMCVSSVRVGLVRKEEAAEHPSEGHPRGAHADGQTARGRRGADLVRRQTTLESTDAVLHVLREVTH